MEKENIMHTLVMVIAPSRRLAEDMLAPYDLEATGPFVTPREDWLRVERAWRRHELGHRNLAPERRREWERLLAMDDDGLARYFIEKEHGEGYDGDGNRIDDFNPRGCWDWYAFGGRWDRETKALQGITVDEYLHLLDDPHTERPNDILDDTDWHHDEGRDDDTLHDRLNQASEASDDEPRVWFFDYHA